jgi:hypothetical protein
MKIIHGHLPKHPIEISGPLWTLLLKAWSFNPEDRPSMAAIETTLAAM